jgi:pyruvate/2-oxoglutarate dehydrogenase complex dihydrolipoamide acyltransferase (E2) component
VLIAVNKIFDKPVAVGDQVKVERVVNMNFTVDHRYIDGGKAGNLQKAFERVFAEPELFIRKNFKLENLDKV